MVTQKKLSHPRVLSLSLYPSLRLTLSIIYSTRTRNITHAFSISIQNTHIDNNNLSLSYTISHGADGSESFSHRTEQLVMLQPSTELHRLSKLRLSPFDSFRRIFIIVPVYFHSWWLVCIGNIYYLVLLANETGKHSSVFDWRIILNLIEHQIVWQSEPINMW